MIDVTYSETFLKDLKELKSTVYYNKIKHICFNELPDCSSIKEIRNIKKIVGHKDSFRIKAGDYRIGIYFKDNVLKVARVLHRKEIYKFFP